MTENFVERRKYPRNEIFLVMEIKDITGHSHKLNVITNNISAGGVYFKTPHGKEFKLGTGMAFTIFLSTPTPQGKPYTSRIEGSGRIVRQDILASDCEEAQDGNWKGIALQFDEPLKML